MTTGSSGFKEVVPWTAGETTPPFLHTISLSEGAKSKERTRCVIAMPENRRRLEMQKRVVQEITHASR